jgi:arsenite methyltransferase
MKSIMVYDRPMCCSTGVCGPAVDPILPRFAANLDAIKKAGVSVERFNLAQQPQAFVQNADVQTLLASEGTDVLPLIIVDGRIVSRGLYPSMEMLQMWTGAAGLSPDAETGAKPDSAVSLPIMEPGCCNDSSGCC